MANFDVKKSARKCYESERTFQPGEEFYSALIELENGLTERRDFAPDLWKGPPDDCIGSWKCSVPEIGKGKVYWAPRSVLIAYFEHVKGHETTGDIAYVTALLLVQKRILKLVDNRGDRSKISLQDHNTKNKYELPVKDISPQRLIEIQDELSEKLFMDRPADHEMELESDSKPNSKNEEE